MTNPETKVPTCADCGKPIKPKPKTEWCECKKSRPPFQAILHNNCRKCGKHIANAYDDNGNPIRYGISNTTETSEEPTPDKFPKPKEYCECKEPKIEYRKSLYGNWCIHCGKPTPEKAKGGEGGVYKHFSIQQEPNWENKGLSQAIQVVEELVK